MKLFLSRVKSTLTLSAIHFTKTFHCFYSLNSTLGCSFILWCRSNILLKIWSHCFTGIQPAVPCWPCTEMKKQNNVITVGAHLSENFMVVSCPWSWALCGSLKNKQPLCPQKFCNQHLATVPNSEMLTGSINWKSQAVSRQEQNVRLKAKIRLGGAGGTRRMSRKAAAVI